MIPKPSVFVLCSIVLALSWMQLLSAKDLGRSVYVSQSRSGQRLEAEFVGDTGVLSAHESGVILADAHLELEGRPKRDGRKEVQKVTPDGCLKGWVRSEVDGQCHKVVAVTPHTGPVKGK